MESNQNSRKTKNKRIFSSFRPFLKHYVLLANQIITEKKFTCFSPNCMLLISIVILYFQFKQLNGKEQKSLHFQNKMAEKFLEKKRQNVSKNQGTKLFLKALKKGSVCLFFLDLTQVNVPPRQCVQVLMASYQFCHVL